MVGQWSNVVVNPAFSPFSSPGTIGGNTIIGVSAHAPSFGFHVTNNPVLLWAATWTPSEFSAPGPVRISTNVLGVPGLHPDTVSLWLVNGQVGPIFQMDAWPCGDGKAVVTVVPAPAGVAALWLGMLLGVPSRRR